MSASDREEGEGGQPAPLQPAFPHAHGDHMVPGFLPVSPEGTAEGLGTATGWVPAALKAEAAEAQRAQERLDRRLADRELIDRLARDDFEGPEYDVFEDALAAYALPVLRGWMYTGYVFTLTAKRGWPLYPTELELDRLRSDSDLRSDLAAFTVARALPFFREHALLNGNWSVEGGANLTTYFTGACTQIFPNEFRRHRREHNKLGHVVLHEDHNLDTSVTASDDPGRIIIGDLWVREVLAGHAPKQRAVVELTLVGYTQIEIGEMLGMTDRAVEGVMYRFRKAMQERGER